MPWNDQNQPGGSGNRPNNPWGQDPGGMRPGDFEEVLQKMKDSLPPFLSGMGGRGWTVAGIAVVILWLLSGFYIVSPYEQGVVLRFGKFVGHTTSGINYHLPWPIEVAYTPEVTRQKQINIGYRTDSDNNNAEDVPDESLMLTGDENIIDINFTVFWQIKDANAYLFNVDLNIGKGDDTVKAVAESAMREVVGQEQMDRIMTSDREQIQRRVKELMQKILDSYNAGIVITDVNMQKADPPMEVRDAYLDVQKALADQDRKRNEAEAYANTIIPQARGKAAQIVQDAEAYRQGVIAEAAGEAKRFISVYQQYKNAPEVTRKRMYYETMSEVLGPMNKIIVDDSAKGVVPYIQLPALARTLPKAQQSTPGMTSSNVTDAPATGKGATP